MLPALLAHHQFGDREELHVRRAFVDLADLRIAEELLHRVVLGEAVAAVDLDFSVGLDDPSPQRVGAKPISPRKRQIVCATAAGSPTFGATPLTSSEIQPPVRISLC